VPIVSDPEMTAYKTFGLERAGVLSFFHPRVLWGFFRGMTKGYMLRMPYAGEDVQQLGGDFILNRQREVVFAYPSSEPTDRPAVSTLLEALGPGS